MDQYSAFRCEINGPVASITLDRPHARNSVDIEMATGLTAVLGELALRPDVRIVVLTGAGDRFFCPGADISPRAAHGEAAGSGGTSGGAGSGGGGRSTEGLSARTIRASLLLHDMPQVTIAAVNGAAAGAGFGLAAACDLRVASTNAVFNTAFLDVGVAGDFGLAWSLSRIVGPARARELFLLRKKFSAEDALRWGIVSELFAPDVFRSEVSAIVDRLAAAAPKALVAVKANFLSADRLHFADYFEIETERHFPLVSDPEFGKGIAAFHERRSQGS